ncbi:hypothetical protein FV230_01125 [Methylobacterium sp. WL6]|nr:hypothetical protein FV230_01125 [Methylobacterium sp. WL6]
MSDAPIRGRALTALRAVATASPQGLRLSAHPSAMPALIELGLVEERQARWPSARPDEMARFLTRSGRDLIRALGNDEAR